MALLSLTFSQVFLGMGAYFSRVPLRMRRSPCR